MLQPKLISVKVQHPLMLHLVFETGERKLFDVAPYVEGSWFGQLSDETYFSAVRLLPNGDGIEWPNGQDIAPHELYESGMLMES